MKKQATLILAILVFAARATAQEAAGATGESPAARTGPFTVDAGTGVYYDANPLPEGTVWAILTVLANLRAGPWIDAEIRLSDTLCVGIESGCQYMASSIELFGTTVTLNLVDIPVRLKTSFAENFLKVETFAGVLFDFVVWDDGSGIEITPAINFDGGLRLMLGNFYAEASLEAPLKTSSGGAIGRFGAGFSFALVE